MYHEKTDTYSCDICGFEMGWEDHDYEHGDLWSCERCGATFCTKCSVEQIGRKAYDEMMQGGGYILCPDCETKIEEAEKAVKRRMEGVNENAEG